MDELMAWLYQEDEKLYDKPTLLKNSKNMKDLGDVIYKRCNDWSNLVNNYSIFESTVNDLTTQVKNEEEKLNKKQYVYVTAEDVEKIHGLINDAIANAKKKHDLTDKAPKINYPPVMPDEVDMLTKNLKENVKKIYDDAEYKVKEAERKKKEEEEKKRKEEEEKKRKEEEEKKKKEEEEKKKKEEEEKKEGDKKEGEKKDEDVEMKDATKPNEEKKEEKKEGKKADDKMDVE